MGQSDKDFLLVLARKSITDALSNREATNPTLKPAEEDKGTSRVVIVTFCAQGRLLQIATGQEDSLANSTRKAAWKIGENSRPFQDAAQALKSGRILIDIVDQRTRIPTTIPRDALRSVNFGLEGIEVNVKGVGAYVSPVTILLNLAQGQFLVAQLYALAGISNAAKTPADVQFYKFTTTSFMESSPGGSPVDVYRGNVLIPKLDPDDLENAADKAGGWLIKMQDAEGKFTYWFHPISQIQESRYDMAHHAAACLAFISLYEKTGDQRYRLAFERGRQYLMRQIPPPTERNGRRIAYRPSENPTADIRAAKR